MSYKTDLQANNSGLQEILDAVNSLPKHEEVILQEKTVTPSTVEQEAIPDDGYTALSKVKVNPIPSEYVVPSGELEIGENGSFDVKNYASAKINVQSGDTLKTLLDATKSTSSLFYSYSGTSVEGLISYSTTENVTSMTNMFQSAGGITTVPLLNTGKVTNMSNMFYGCHNLTTVPLFDTSNVTSMYQMFYGCYKLTAVPLFNTSNVTDMQNFFYRCEVLTAVPLFDTSKVTNMGSMLNSCTKITTVPLFNTSNVTSMSSMFYACAFLPSVRILDASNVKNVSSMFYNSTSLKEVVIEKISSKVTSSSKWFGYCKALEVVYFKDATSIPKLSGTDAFTNVPSTCKVVVPDTLYDEWINATNWSAINVTWVKQSEYENPTGGDDDSGDGEELVPTEGLAYSLSSDGTYAWCDSIGSATETDIVIANEYEGVPVTTIDIDAFKNSNITSVIIPEGIKFIYNSAFYSCTGLTSIKFPDSLLQFNGQSFQNCSNLTSVIMGANVKKIESQVFTSCSSLKRVDFSKHTTIPTIGNAVFAGCSSDLQIKVPASLIDSWKSATNWSNFAEKIVTEFTNEV